MNRHEELRKRFEEKRKDFIVSLSGRETEDLAAGEEINLAYSIGVVKYEKLKKDGKIPTYCRVIENLWDLSRSRKPILTGKVEQDPVYNFLLEVRKQLEDIAGRQYTEKHGPMPRGVVATGMNAYDYEMGLETVVSTKREFVDSLLCLIEKRTFNRSPNLRDWEEDVVLNEARYYWLRGMNHSRNRDVLIERLVESFPSYGWERFHWGCDAD